MKRKFYQELLNWKADGCLTPLMVIGARQIGKTYIINEFCKEHFQDYIYLNLQTDKKILDVFNETIVPDEILYKLELILNKKIDIETTVFFIDEIQVSENAVSALKYFCESQKPFKIVTAGSLLGVKLNRFSQSFPVGKVIIKKMYPMDFEEFLMALNKDLWISEIKTCFEENKKCILHDELIKLYRMYLCIGGLPMCINKFRNANCDILGYDTSFLKSIITSYLADMAKYTKGIKETKKIEAIYKSLPKQLAKENKKFQYSEIKEGGSKRNFSSSMDWLLASSMVYKCRLLDKIEKPLSPFANDNFFKLYLNDVGILTSLSETRFNDILLSEKMMFLGALTENYIATQFASKDIPLYYWRSSNQAEIDFIIQNESGIIPIEVKAGKNVASKSLSLFMQKYSSPYAIRLSEKNFGFENSIKSVPLYAGFCI